MRTSQNQADNVCVPCKRRKKRCDKSLPRCSRCARFNTHCTYTELPKNTSAITLTEAIAEYAAQSTDSVSSGTLRDSSSPLNHGSTDLGEIVALQLRILVDRISPRRAEDYKNYFANFHISMPIVNEEDFYWRLRNSTPSQYMIGLMLSMSLVAQLSSKADDALERAMEIYHTLKAVYSHCQPAATPVVEFVQAGVLISSFEHCQGLHREAWMTIGSCVRMGHIVRQQELVTKTGSMMDEEDANPRATLWYSMAVLERVISADYMENKLPHATASPKPNDILPVASSEDQHGCELGHNMFLAEDFETHGNLRLRTSEFTTLSPFATTVQATYLSSLVTEHVIRGSTDTDARRKETTRLDVILQSYGGALIPPPGKAVGHYCGAFGIRTCALFYLHEEELKLATQARDNEQITRSTAALQSLTRIIIYTIKTTYSGVFLDLNTIAFWAHKIIYHAALCHIRYGARDPDLEWQDDLETCRSYFRHFTPRYKLHCNYLHEIDTEQRKMRWI